MVKQHATVTRSDLQDNNDFLADLQKIYGDYCEGYDSNPFVSPVFRLALDINRGLEQNEISLRQITDAVQNLTNTGLSQRAANIARYLGNCNVKENTDKIDSLFTDLIQPNGNAVPFQDFKNKIERLFYGFVFTAHPTFSMSMELSHKLAGHAAGLAGAEEHASLEELYKAAELPFTPPNLDDENTFSLHAIDNLHHVMALMLERLFTVAAEHYPDDWENLEPRLFSLATWVGFDIDGRRDISWATTLEKRIFLQLQQLRAYQTRFAELLEEYPEDCEALTGAKQHIDTTLDLLDELQQDFANYNQDEDDNLEGLQRLSRQLIDSSTERLTNASSLITDVDSVLHSTTDKGLKVALAVLKTQLRNFGLSRADVHFRINSAQLHNAISDRIRLVTHPDHPTKRREYTEDLLDIIDRVKPVNVSFGDIADEEITAKYEFMLIQEITQYIDNDSPIRFLIAETESAFTVLTALYYAKLFGVEDKIDICPLFETDQALQDSSRYMDALLDSDAYSAYIKQRGRLCIQTGYSDAGRYIGQPAAGASIERLKERFVQLFKDRKVKDISLLFFDTHGESIGRGGHPESFHKRLQYVSSPYVLSQAAEGNISYTQESSYQGGDGFLNFMTHETSLAVLTRTLEYWLQDHSQPIDDPYYQEPFRSDVTRFFTESTRFQLSLINDPQYADLLFAFSINMTNPSGSRAVKRQRGIPSKKQSVNDIRAIPTNAILGQMGVLANTVSGIGRAMREYSDFSVDIAEKSQRFQTIMSLINSGAERSYPQIMRSYINLLDPTLWITQANSSTDIDQSNRMATIATNLEKHDFHNGMMEMFRKICWDFTLLKRFNKISPHQNEVEMACLHALRIALILHVFMMATQIPRYSPRHSVSRDELIRMIFQMNIEGAVNVLERVFPANTLKTEDCDFGETSEYRKQGDGDGYKNIQDNLMTPMLEIHKITKDISTALAHYIGFFG